MQRVSCDERPDWRAQAEKIGFDFHTPGGERYWDERAYYSFSLKEIETQFEAPTAELDAMCREVVARAVTDERAIRTRHSGTILELDRSKLEAIGAEPLRPLRFEFRRHRSGQIA